MVTDSVIAEHASLLLGTAPGLLTLQVCSREHHGRILRIRSPKCTIGSHSSCTLRLRAAGIRPFHCMILRGSEGTFIRRWSGDTCLNGASFQDTRLNPGDRLNIGPVELRVLDPSPDATPLTPHAPASADSSAGTIPEAPGPRDDTSSRTGAQPASPDSSHCGACDDNAVEKGEEARARVCQDCRERTEMEAALATHAARSDQHRSVLLQQCAELSGDLKQSEVLRKQLSRNSDKLTDQRIQEHSGYRELIDALRGELNELRARHAVQLAEQEQLVAQAADSQQQLGRLRAELEAVRQQAATLPEQTGADLDEVAEQLLASEDRVTELQSQLQVARDQAQQALEAGRREAEVLRGREDQWKTAHAEHESERARWEAERAEWERTEKQLRDQLVELNRGVQAATESLEKAQNRSNKLEQLLADTAQELAQYEASPDGASSEGNGDACEVSKWRDLADNARRDQQQERAEHQRVRNEWHVERASLQSELAERSTTLEELTAKHAQQMSEAEFLILSLQREGKQLLAQLDEAKQAIRRDGDKRRRPEASEHNSVDAAADRTMLMPGGIGDLLHSESPDPQQHAAVAPNPQGPVEATPEASSASPAVEHAEVPDSTAQPQCDVCEDAVKESGIQETADPPSEPIEPFAAEQAVEQQRDDVVDDAGETNLGAEAAAVEPPIVTPTLQLDPDQLRKQAQAIQVQELIGAEITDGVAALFANSSLEQEEEPESADDESVIQRYMERLLKRVASHGTDEPEPSRVAPTPSPEPVPQTEPPSTPEPIDVVNKASRNVAAESAPQDTPQPQETAPLPHPLKEMASDLLVMRELANNSARDAIQSSEQRRYTTLALGELLVATVCLVCAGSLFAMSPLELNAQTAGGGLGLSFGAVMFLRGGYKFFSFRRHFQNQKAKNITSEPAEFE